MNRAKILRGLRLANAVFERERLSEFRVSHIFQDFKNQLGLNRTLGNQIIAMITVLQGQPVGCDRIPERQIVQRLQPFDHVLNIFKYDHLNTLSNRPDQMQICRGMEAVA